MSDEKPKTYRTTISFEQEDKDILEFFNRKGSNDSTTFKMALREYYKQFASEATIPGNRKEIPDIGVDD